MYVSKNGAINVDSLAVLWGPRLVRFYFYMCTDKTTAESCAIETMAEAVRSHRLGSNPLPLVRLAIGKSARLPPGNPNADRLARAVLSLPERQRLAVALARGMGLSTQETAEAMAIEILDAKRLLADGLLELHRLLLKEPDRKLENSSET